MIETCEHGAIWSREINRTNRGCCVRDFPPDHGPPLTEERLRVYREIAFTLTEGTHTRHRPGEFVVHHHPHVSQGQFIHNTRTGYSLWEARWGNGPATEALALAPWAMRELIREVDRLREQLREHEQEINDLERYTGMTLRSEEP